MKYFKIIFLSVCLVATCFVLWKCTKEQHKENKPTTIVQRDGGTPASSDPCEGNSIGNCTGDYYTVNTVVTLPDYPDCSFTITYKYRSCPSGIDIIFLYFNDASVLDPYMCPQLQSEWENQDPANTVNAQLFIDGFENKLAKKLAKQIANANAPACGTATPTSVSFISGSCNYYCLYRDNDPATGGKRKKSTYNCGDICCEQKYSICKETNGDLTITKIGSTTPYGNCQESNWIRPCPDYTFYRSTCQEKCRFNF